MAVTVNELMTFVAALFSMMNPIGGVGVFAGMTANKSAKEATQIAGKCAIAAAITLLVVVWVGNIILNVFGINVNEIRVAGGLIVLIIGLNMLFDKHEHNSARDDLTDDDGASIAIVPLAIPILAGPGTMAAVLVTAQHHTGAVAHLEMSAVIIAICIATGILFSFAKPIANRIGDNGMAVASRIMGLILMAIGVGMLGEGLTTMFPVLGK